MAVTMDLNLKDFLKALYPQHSSDPEQNTPYVKALTLEHQGWKFTFQMFQVIATKGGVTIPENMPALIPGLVGGKLNDAALKVFRKAFEKHLATIQVAEDQPAIKSEASGTKTDPTAALKKSIVENVVKGTLGPSAKEKAAVVEAMQDSSPKKASDKKPSLGMVKLSEATQVGQMVFGTSEGSEYRTVAVGPVNVAVRIAPGALSVRVEGSFTGDISNRLKGMGFKLNAGGHMSAHFQSTATCPPSRVVGAVLMGMQVPFKDMVSDGGQLK